MRLKTYWQIASLKAMMEKQSHQEAASWWKVYVPSSKLPSGYQMGKRLKEINDKIPEIRQDINHMVRDLIMEIARENSFFDPKDDLVSCGHVTGPSITPSSTIHFFQIRSSGHCYPRQKPVKSTKSSLHLPGVLSSVSICECWTSPNPYLMCLSSPF
ncbi:hypothetical protein SAY86_020274 [Trapa natans]|uniref:Uncharacterized protein n=1 Tax=Trapa natans TaxID=22666 RepID=A0AAN7LN55_TRANT|nr:hypothetical protein SAY86_020274 [Trapa natans]